MTRLFEALQREHPGIRLSIAKAKGAELDLMLDTGAVDLAILFRAQQPNGCDEKALCVAHTYLVAAPDDTLTRAPVLAFQQLRDPRLVLPRRPGQWRQTLDEAART